MTVNSSDIVSGPYTGNGVASQFSYDFRVDLNTQLTVFETTDAGVVSTLTVDVDYTVNNVGVDGGGTIDRTAGALPSGYSWYIRSNYLHTQSTDFESQSGFFPDVHESAFDKLTFLSLQQQDLIARAVRLPDSYSGVADLQLPNPEADKTILWSADGLALVNGPTVATFAGYASSAEANAVSTAADAVQTGLDRIATAADVVTISGSEAATAADRVQTGLDAAATAADALATAADLVQTNLDQIQTSADAVATAADAVTVAGIYDSFDDRYLGSKAVAPTLDNDGNALLTGALYWDTTLEAIQAYSGTEWISASASVIDTITQELVYTATASQTVFSGADDNGVVLLYDTDASILVYLNGAKLLPAVDYTLDNLANTVTLTVGADLNDEIAIVSFNFLSSTTLTATNVANTPAGNIAATNVQAAIDELDTDKAGLALDNVFTGRPTIEAVNPFIRFNATGLGADLGNLDLSTANGVFTFRSKNDAQTLIRSLLGVNRDGIVFGFDGLLFPATQVPSADPNTLDDYEEGTVTITASCSTSGTITLDSSNTASYVKIGKLVTVTGYLGVASVSSPIGALNLNGLPFTNGNTTEYRTACSVAIFTATPAFTEGLIGIMSGNTSVISIRENGGAGAGQTVADNITASSVIYFSVTYNTGG
tara:strand:- start:7996 stop:9963 length:1968 start_codon:yes stop_codon:yes gene_type:complete